MVANAQSYESFGVLFRVVLRQACHRFLKGAILDIFIPNLTIQRSIR